jgi:hypothetical protein
MNKLNLFFWSFIILFLFSVVIYWGDYLIKNGYIVENFTDMGDPSTNHTVNLPLTTKQTCKNMCGPNNRCSLTGEQCSSDIDCFGCNPEKIRENRNKQFVSIHGQNDAGKLTTGATPVYSSLTTDIGTQAKLISKPETDVPQYFQGVNTWRNTFDSGMELYDKRYTPTVSYFTPNYPERKTLSGEFFDNGPLAANDFL